MGISELAHGRNVRFRDEECFDLEGRSYNAAMNIRNHLIAPTLVTLALGSHQLLPATSLAASSPARSTSGHPSASKTDPEPDAGNAPTAPTAPARPILGGSRVPPRNIAARAGYDATQRARLADAVQAAFTARTQTRESFTTDGGTVNMFAVQSLRLHISASCRRRGGVLACAAFEALKDIPGKVVNVGPGNPSSYYCSAAGGTEVALHSPAGESGGCRFADGSIIDSWSLVYTPNIVLGTP